VAFELMLVCLSDPSTHKVPGLPTCELGTPAHMRSWAALGVSHARAPLENIIINTKNILLFIL